MSSDGLVECMELYNLLSFTRMDLSQWRIQDFPDQGAPTPDFGSKTYYLSRFLTKTVWKWKTLYREGARFTWPPSPLESASVQFPCILIDNPDGYFRFRLLPVINVSVNKNTSLSIKICTSRLTISEKCGIILFQQLGLIRLIAVTIT